MKKCALRLSFYSLLLNIPVYSQAVVEVRTYNEYIAYHILTEWTTNESEAAEPIGYPRGNAFYALPCALQTCWATVKRKSNAVITVPVLGGS